MGCNCGSKKKRTMSYLWKSGDGKDTKVFRSEIEAKFYKNRNGGDYKPQ